MGFGFPTRRWPQIGAGSPFPSRCSSEKRGVTHHQVARPHGIPSTPAFPLTTKKYPTLGTFLFVASAVDPLLMVPLLLGWLGFISLP
jgi:hypothetical protein